MDKYIFFLLLLFVGFTSTILQPNFCIKPAPDQIRLAFAGDTGVNVGWHIRSYPNDTTNPNPYPTVIFGTSSTQLNLTSVNGKSSFYTPGNISGTSWFYSVELQNLEPFTLYYYQITASNFVSASVIFNFTSAPTLGDRSRAVKIAAYGDLGVDGWLGTFTNGPCLFAKALNALQQKLSEIDFFIHHGDICYADDGPLLVPPKPYEATLGLLPSGNVSFNKCTFLHDSTW